MCMNIIKHLKYSDKDLSRLEYLFKSIATNVQTEHPFRFKVEIIFYLINGNFITELANILRDKFTCEKVLFYLSWLVQVLSSALYKLLNKLTIKDVDITDCFEIYTKKYCNIN